MVLWYVQRKESVMTYTLKLSYEVQASSEQEAITKLGKWSASTLNQWARKEILSGVKEVDLEIGVKK